MRSSVFVFLLIVNQISQFRSEITPYRCESKHLELIREKIRFIPFFHSQVQFILDELTIHFDLPKFENLYSELGPRYLFYHLPYLEKGIDYTQKDVLGLYQRYVEQHENVYAFYRELDENNKFKLSEKADLISKNSYETILDTTPFKPLLGDISADTKIYVQKSNEVLIFKYDLNDATPQLEYQLLSDEVTSKLVDNLKFKLKFFALNEEAFRIEEKLILKFTFIDENFDFHFEEQSWDFTGSKIDREYTGPFSLERLLSCPVRPKSESELKGIFFDRRKNKFNIIINFLYLEFDQIPSDKFQIDDKLYSEAGYLDIREKYLLFDHIITKWIKNLNQSSYLVPLDPLSYDLNNGGIEENLRTMPRPISTILYRCVHQTFQVQDHIFCFDEKDYWHLNTIDKLNGFSSQIRNYTKQKIGTIFDGLPELNFENQKLKFIFNHNEEDKYVFMTNEYLLIFDYNRFETVKLDAQDENNIGLKYVGDKESYTKIQNSWLKDFYTATQTSIKDKENTQTSSPSSTQSKGGLLGNLLYIVIGVIILLILAAFLVKRFYSREKITSQLDSNQSGISPSDTPLTKEKSVILNKLASSKTSIVLNKKSKADLESSSSSVKKPGLSLARSNISGIASKTSNISGITSGASNLSSIASGASNLSGITSGTSNLSGITSGTSNLSGITSGTSNLSGITSGTSNLSGITSSNIPDSSIRSDLPSNIQSSVSKFGTSKAKSLPLSKMPASSKLSKMDNKLKR